MKKPRNSLPMLALFLILPFAAGAIGSFFTFDAIPSWYATLQKPFFSPPNYVFGPVWSALYLLIGISGYLAWRAKAGNAAMGAFGAQLGLNALWSVVFFGLRMPPLALVVIVLLLASIAYMAKSFHKSDKNAAYLLVPYLLWVGFAMCLNAAIVLLN